MSGNETSILKKIKALMDKAASTDSIAEKESFMLGAQKLLQKYNLDMSEVQTFQSDDRKVMEDIISYSDDWERNLMSAIARNNFCRILLNTYDLQIIVIGKTDNVGVCIYIFNFFRSALLELSVKAYLGFLESLNDGLKKKVKIPEKKLNALKEKYIHDYLYGGVDGVKDKLELQKKTAEIENANLRGLMVTNEREISVYVDEKYGRFLGRARQSNKGNQSSGAYSQGRKDGFGISQGNTALNSGTKRIG
jgi:hypothetical protein